MTDDLQAKVAEIRERHKQFKRHADSYRHSYSDTDYRRFTLADIDTLLDALDAERAKCDKLQALRGSETRRYLTETKKMQSAFESHYKPLLDAERERAEKAERALRHIADPIVTWRRECDESNGARKIDGEKAVRLANSAQYLRQYAADAIERGEHRS